MAMQDLKITQYDGLDVASAPDKLQGTAAENKAIFDALVKGLNTPKFNSLIDELTTATAAAQLGSQVEGLAADRVAGALAELLGFIQNRFSKEETTALVTEQTHNLLETLAVDLQTGVITATKRDGTSQTWDTALEKVPASFDLAQDGDTVYLVVTNQDGSQSRAEVSSLLNLYDFTPGITVAFSVTGEGNHKTVSAEVRDGSIGPSKFTAEVTGTLQQATESAAASATAAQQAATTAGTSAQSAAEQAQAATAQVEAAKQQVQAAADQVEAAKGQVQAATGQASAAAASATSASAEAAKAAESANQVAGAQTATAASAQLAQSYAVGGTGTRDGEDADNAKYYKEQAAQIAGGDYATRDELAATQTAAATDAQTKADAAQAAAIAAAATDAQTKADTAQTAAITAATTDAQTKADAAQAAAITAAATDAQTKADAAAAASVPLAQKGVASGVATLGVDSKVPPEQLPELAGPVINYTLGAVGYVKLADLSEPRNRLAAATDGAGNVLFGGGGKSAAVDKYAPDGTHTVLEDLSEPVSSPAAATNSQGNVLFGGGVNSNTGVSSAAVNQYTADGAHSKLADLSVARDNLAAAADSNGNVLFGGGYDSDTAYTSSAPREYATVDKYDSSGTHTTLDELSVARWGLAAAADGEGNVLFGGGDGDSGGSATAVDRFTPSGVRTALTPLTDEHWDLAASTDGNGNVLFGGGGVQSAAVEKYDTSGTRTTLENLSVGRYGLAAATDGNGNVLFGGGDGDDDIAAVDYYTPAGEHSTLPDLSVARQYLAAATDGNGYVLFGGGEGKDGDLAVVEKYRVAAADMTLPVLLGAKYKFEEHDTEQIAYADTITVKRPNTGYIKLSGEITI